MEDGNGRSPASRGQGDDMTASPTKTGTSMQPANSSDVPSPSSPSSVPSMTPGDDSEKRDSGASSVSNAGNSREEQTSCQSPSVGSPRIAPSSSPREVTDSEYENQGGVTDEKSSAEESPIQRLVRVMSSMFPAARNLALNDMASVVTQSDILEESEYENEFVSEVEEDSATMERSEILAGDFTPLSDRHDPGTMKIRRELDLVSLNPLSLFLDVGDDSIQQSRTHDSLDLERTAISRTKRQKVQSNSALVKEIRETNQRLMDISVEISGEAAVAAENNGTTVNCSFHPVGISPELTSQLVSSQMFPIAPLRMLIPETYPNSSPIILNKLPDNSSEDGDLSSRAMSKFGVSICGLPQPMSLGKIARIWGACVREVIDVHAQQNGGGSFTSVYGTWKNA